MAAGPAVFRPVALVTVRATGLSLQVLALNTRISSTRHDHVNSLGTSRTTWWLRAFRSIPAAGIPSLNISVNCHTILRPYEAPREGGPVAGLVHAQKALTVQFKPARQQTGLPTEGAF